MKMRYFFVFFLLCIMTLASSQSFTGGLVGGLNAARIDNDGHELYAKLGLNAGAFISREIIPHTLDWQLELKYTSRGKYQGPTPNNYGIKIIDLKYVELPISVQYRFSQKLQFALGISPDLLLREYYADENGELPPDHTNNRFGLTALAEINYFVLDALAVGVRFNYSVIPFYKFDGHAIRYQDSGWFHDVLSLNAKYYFIRN